MTLSRETRSLLLKVGVVAAALVALSRWSGRLRDGGLPAPDDATMAESAGGAPEAARGLDLSFYRSLEAGRASALPSLPRATLEQSGPGGDEQPAGGAWVVQAVATRDAATARRIRDRLAAKGLPAVMIEADAGGTTVFRVRVGRYADRPVAEAMARRLRRDHGLEPWVLKEGG